MLLTPHHDATNATTLVRYPVSTSTMTELSEAAPHTFSFNALWNPLVSIILTRESFGYKPAETNDGARARININREGSISAR
jgi:hypothetical protein